MFLFTGSEICFPTSDTISMLPLLVCQQVFFENIFFVQSCDIIEPGSVRAEYWFLWWYKVRSSSAFKILFFESGCVLFFVFHNVIDFKIKKRPTLQNYYSRLWPLSHCLALLDSTMKYFVDPCTVFFHVIHWSSAAFVHCTQCLS